MNPDLEPFAPASAQINLCVLDIEVSGFGRHRYSIEIGYVMPNGVLPEAQGEALRELGLQRHRASNDPPALQQAMTAVA